MARFSRIEVALKMKESGIVPIFYSGDAALCKKVIKACYDGGIRLFEFTNRGDFATLIFAEVSNWVTREMPEMILGAGSVIDAGTASMYIALGAGFIVSPLIDEGVASVCNKRKIAWVPGCGTVTEIGRAHELGAEVVKLFPAKESGGPGFVKAILGPMPWTSIMPTGGVSPDEENLTQWFKAGIHCVAMGSQLFPEEILKQEDFNQITEKCRETLSIITKIRKS